MTLTRILATLTLAFVVVLGAGCTNSEDSKPSQDATPVGTSNRGFDTPPPIQTKLD